MKRILTPLALVALVGAGCEEQGQFNRGSFYFRPQRWTVAEMVEVMQDIAERSVLYYFSKYKEDHFQREQ